jgi:hypothetical protein
MTRKPVVLDLLAWSWRSGSLHEGHDLLQRELAIFVGVHCLEYALVSRLKLLQRDGPVTVAVHIANSIRIIMPPPAPIMPENPHKMRIPSSGLMSASAGCGHATIKTLDSYAPILLQKSQIARRQFSCCKKIQPTTVDRCGLNHATEVASEFIFRR